ncbi:hypothetical protein [Pseudomonas sp. 1121_17]|uniref:hypothetical protein n=1 Tax=Pseudomonas sp. 1121_17 TaxID=2604458 RepID=UPI0040642F74
MNPSIDLEAAKAAFLSSGGSIVSLEGFEYVPHRKHRDVEKVQAAKPKPQSAKKKRRHDQLVYLRSLAKTMTCAEARERTGLCRTTLYLAAVEGGFSFQPEPRTARPTGERQYASPEADKELARQITELRDAGLNRTQAKAKLGISDRKFCRVIHLFGVDYPKVEGKRCDGPI